ncbi:uncharacterized protein LOC109533590 isoform X2 [Dendroctonus ponderosae]|uniref:uncharacterized protein LOC109533590 isoform X2 n=1 Tax=Dendroctonus ponderosae TaxID=77166 RepID=UPI002034C81F|nr:uncharacterized protein LOC109533590 isoform X2 [Dendroctonus ponderosae]
MEPSATNKPINQKRMGPAPFASFEDLSDEMDSPGEKEVAVIRLPGISEQEVPTPSPDPECKGGKGVSLIGNTLRNSHSTSPNSLSHSPLPIKMKLANTPRIDISRASSSSHHDSRDSSPEREIFESTDPNAVKLGLGFKEDDALELRLSTEELDFHDVAETKTHKYKHRSASPEFDELYINSNSNRKDSQCSDVILLSISGRTSRISSIGSQGSAVSRLSNASHVSIMSGQSAYSQCSSPHKTLLETSFCGYKGSQANIGTDNADAKNSDDFEKVVLSRKSHPGEAVLVEGLKTAKSKPDQGLQKESSDGRAESKSKRSKLPRKIISKSGIEYIYIPLKGPLPQDDSEEKVHSYKRVDHSSGAPHRHGKKSSSRPTAPKPLRPTSVQSQSHSQEPKYIRIKLKPDHCYEDDGASTSAIIKPASLNLPFQKENGTAGPNFNIQTHARSLTNSPKLPRKEIGACSPSQPVPRRNSFATLFRTDPDSPGASKQKRKNTLIGCVGHGSKSKGPDHSKVPSANVSSTESVDSKGKHKSVLSLFKFPKEKPKVESAAPRVKATEPKKERREHQPPSNETIRIPLHSPKYYESKSLLQEVQTSSQDSQVTVVEVLPPPAKAPAAVTSLPEEVVANVDTLSREVEVVVVAHPQPLDRAEVIDISLPAEGSPEAHPDSKLITTTAEIEPTNIPEDASSHSLSLSNRAEDDQHNSSESERDTEMEYRKSDKPLLPESSSERKSIVHQQDSFEDELPYVPTTLPQERSSAIPILPIKQRCVLDMKTCPIDRPRSTTPIHSSGLENYFDGFATRYEPSEKLKISLPRPDLPSKPKESAGEEAPPPLPPKGIQKSWINFEDVPERRKNPKRIQTIPSRGHIDISGLVKDNVVYTYVNPDECKCECHEHKESEIKAQEDELPLLHQEDKGATMGR